MQKRSFSEKELKDVRYCYFKIPRCLPIDPMSPVFFTTITIAYHGNRFGMAIQSPNDEVNKGIGRSVAMGRLTLDKTRRTFSFKPEEANKRNIGKELFEIFKNHPEILPEYFDNMEYDNDDDNSLAEKCLENALHLAFIDYIDHK